MTVVYVDLTPSMGCAQASPLAVEILLVHGVTIAQWDIDVSNPPLCIWQQPLATTQETAPVRPWRRSGPGGCSGGAGGAGGPRCRCHSSARRRRSILRSNFPQLQSEPRRRRRRPGGTGRGGEGPSVAAERRSLPSPARRAWERPSPACGSPGAARSHFAERVGGGSRSRSRSEPGPVLPRHLLLSAAASGRGALLLLDLVLGQESPSMPIAHLLELWKGIEVEPMETETVVEDSVLDEEPVKEVMLTR
ncbi:uncharacterized protein LOC117244070 [Parus major]|uniref:uncharacterized protein LOC117244070 n=1 Tax=Parus major TaxID=9157 RepID=UPI0014439CC5|nr:uncharacterized protein LOC117244070 [Parus major]